MNKPITVAVMGCIVNGPGETKEKADVGIAGGGVLFAKGKKLKTLPYDQRMRSWSILRRFEIVQTKGKDMDGWTKIP